MALQALTIWQPWAWCIAERMKWVENRTWRPPHAAIGQYLAIHAGKAFAEEAPSWVEQNFGIEVPEVLVTGAIIAVVKLERFVKRAEDLPEHQRRWFSGPFGWLFSEQVAIDPVPCKGAQGLWTVPSSAYDAVRRRYAEARRAA